MDLKRTKIVATISDLNCDVELIRVLFESGMNVVRLNTAHQDQANTLKVINNARQVSERLALLLDTKGPEIRTTEATENIPVEYGDVVKIMGDPSGITSRTCIYTNYAGFVQDVPVGSRVMIDDGNIELVVTKKQGNALLCQVRNQGVIKGNKSVNIPSVHVKLPSLSQKDINYINFAVDHNLDFIAHSFVRSAEDIIAIRQILDKRGSDIKIIAKIENQQGVDNIDEILDHAYGIMVARGDLAVEIPQERIPIVQKLIVNKCKARRKPVIIATQMLHSMIEHPRPTRAEISDVANAVFDGTDALMLSGETAYGMYPAEAVTTMSQIAIEVESSRATLTDISEPSKVEKIVDFLARAAVRASKELNAKAIVADTLKGRTIRTLAAYRGQNVIFAQCYDKRVMRELAVSYGVFANYIEIGKSTEDIICQGLNALAARSNLNEDDFVVIIAGNFGPTHGPSFIEISSIGNLLKMCASAALDSKVSFGK
jgi:pyruvate kinase